MKIWERARVALGEGHVEALTIFEWKRLFSIIVYDWKTVDQGGRFHTHAFPSFAVLLRGGYAERRIVDGVVEQNYVSQRWRPRWLPRGYCHTIELAEPRTKTIVFAGPWQRTWREYFEDSGTWVTYGWGRRVLRKVFAPLVGGQSMEPIEGGVRVTDGPPQPEKAE